MFFKKRNADAALFDGNWEEPGVIGTRIEIENGKVVILWRNSPVLKTRFKVQKNDDGTLEALLEENGLRYENTDRVYATVTRLALKGDTLCFDELFPISGPSQNVLKRTDHSRYGDYTIVDREILPQLEGRWASDDGYVTLRFRGNTLHINEDEIRIHALKSNGSFNGTYKIVNEDPSVYEVGHFYFMNYEGGALTAAIMVCDAPPAIMRFSKKQ